MLPTNLAAPHRWTSRLPEFARRALQQDQMELDSALSQMYALCTNPSLVSRISKARKMTKNHYHRDDPAFVVLQILFLTAVTAAYGFATGSRLLHVVYNVVYQVGINYVTVGALIATGTWTYANRFLMTTGQLHEVRKDVEWQHAFDIHCNGYFTYFAWTHVLQFILLPILLRDNFFAQFLANAVYCVGVTAYCYSTLHGFLELPTLNGQKVFLYPAVVFVAFTVLATIVSRLNYTHAVVYSMWPAYS